MPVFGIILAACFIIIPAALIMAALREAPDRSPGTQPETLPPLDTTIDVQSPPADVITEDDTPTPPPPAVKVKGIYYNVYFPQNNALERCVQLIEQTDLNAIVIDVKEDNGFFTFPTENEVLVGAFNAFKSNYDYDYYGNLVEREDIADMKERGVYAIARVVCFLDNRYVGGNPSHALADQNGGAWRDSINRRWIDPYNKDAWEYLLEVCKEAAEIGFDEIQLDYVRFPSDGRLSSIDYGPAAEEQKRYQIISEFVAFIREEMAELGVKTSADIFGIVGMSYIDASAVGQNVGLLLGNLDSICPMIYPSHFANIEQNGEGQYINGILFERPDTEPYEVVYNVLQHYKRQVEEFAEAYPDVTPAVIRPYLQYFTASWLHEECWILYEPEQILAQIQAVEDAGFEEWLLWRQSDNNYNIDAIP